MAAAHFPGSAVQHADEPTHEAAPVAPAKDASGRDEAHEEAGDAGTLAPGLYMVSTRTCPNCRLAARKLEEAGIPFTKILAEDAPQIAERFKVMAVPTMIEVADDGATRVAHGASESFALVAQLEEAAVAAR